MTQLDTFPGFGEHAPLDVSPGTLTFAAQAARGRTFRTALDAFAETAAAVGFCSHPIRLNGSSMTIDTTTGVVVSEYHGADAPMGQLYRPCGNRRADVCPACSRIYARDTFAMIRSGLLGGKTVPETVAQNPLVFATLTAPSFGHVHGTRPKNGHKAGGTCRPYDRTKTCPHGRSMSCMRVHTDTDPIVGSPLCWDCYDFTTAVVWQWHAPELWRRFTIALRRALASYLGLTDSQLRDVCSVQYAKVAEYQARGLVHFHALIRLDGPDGPGSPAPVDGTTLAGLIEQAARGVRLDVPPVDGADVPRVLAFGTQLDVRTVRTGLPGTAAHSDVEDARTSDTLVPEQVAGYLAKYATKSTNVDPASPRPHLARLTRECRRLADRAATACRPDGYEPEEDEDGCVCGTCIDSPYRLLAKWAHMLGFRGHFSTKSRRYSVTLGRLRAARARYARLKAQAERDGQPLDVTDLERRLLADDEETTLVVQGSWTYAGTGWSTNGEKELAEAAAARAREYAQWKAAQNRPGQPA
ncbi:replication initiator [Promicromonospora citrea]|uniref:Plasmid replication initiator protein n=1 Tax=Promicromonospora citrea TaxID=43677 RepID=A0A8H9L3K4_9MICO|nr:replication initiator [Promicromonospora citrea]NNH53365.1 replication initiation protein [Promicromonospora citrea]GGM20298.1 plasmid replication initiator protein [Promicromonospora citrea]